MYWFRLRAVVICLCELVAFNLAEGEDCSIEKRHSLGPGLVMKYTLVKKYGSAGEMQCLIFLFRNVTRARSPEMQLVDTLLAGRILRTFSPQQY